MSVKLQSKDGEIFTVDREIVACSNVIKKMFIHSDDSNEEEEVPVEVDSNTLKKIIEWATHHKNDPPVSEEDEEEKYSSTDIPSWDAELLQDDAILIELLKASDYLEIKGLRDITCKAVANRIKGKTPEELREIFNLPDDLTSERKEQIRRENEWTEEK